MEYGMRRIKDVRQRLNVTVAMVPPKFVRQIEQGRHRALKAQVRRSERVEQWESLKRETALTEQTFRRCFPRGMLPAWRAAIEEASPSPCRDCQAAVSDATYARAGRGMLPVPGGRSSQSAD